VDKKVRDYWVSEIEKNYAGDEGRKRIRMAAINLRDRDGLHTRAADVECPVLWLHVSLLQLLVFFPGYRQGWKVWWRCISMRELTLRQGTADAVYTVANAREEIKLFTGSPDAKLEIVQDGQHFLSASHPKEVNEFVIGFVKKYTK
jgi:hypothetical protein